MPLVSVIMPTYNRAHTIQRAIKSILNQTYKDFEIIIVDDASTDSTPEVIRNINDKRIRYLRHEKNKGAPAARNTGIRAACGEFIAFQDSDDEWLTEKLEKQIKIFQSASPEVGIVYSGFWRIVEGTKTYFPLRRLKRKEGNLLEQLLAGNFINTPCMLVRKSCFKKAGLFDEAFPCGQDWELSIRLARDFYFSFVDEPLVLGYRGPDGIGAKGLSHQALRLILEKYEDEYRKYNVRLLSMQYCAVGSGFFQSGQTATGLIYIRKAIKTFFLNPKAWLNFFIFSFLSPETYSKIRKIYHQLGKLKNLLP